MRILDLEDIPHETPFLPLDDNGREIKTYYLKQCFFTGENLYYPNVLVSEGQQLYNPIQEKIMSLDIKVKLEFEVPSVSRNVVENTPLFFFVYNTDNYYHFVYDTLPYLLSYQHLKRSIPALKLLMNYPNPQQLKFYPFVLEFLSLLGIETDELLIIKTDTIYQEVHFSTSYTHAGLSNHPPRVEIYSLYQQLLDTVKDITLPTPPKIYISRRTWLHGDYSNIGTNYTTRRKCINEDELVSYLMGQGFVEIFTENLSTIAKIKYFMQAEQVIGAIGGGICNVLFSPPTTKLMALISPSFLEVNRRFIYSLQQVDVNYFKHTSHVEVGRIKTNMRVQTPGGIIGEVVRVIGDEVLINYTQEKVSGWNQQNTYDQLLVPMDTLKVLDGGLNAPWQVNLEKIKTCL